MSFVCDWDVYISSSWKCRADVRSLAERLRNNLGLRVYDFTDPKCRQVPEIPPEAYPRPFDPSEGMYRDYLHSVPAWKSAVEANRSAIQSSRAVLLILPCGSDAHADWAFGVGKGLRTAVVGQPNYGDRTPTHMWADSILNTQEEALQWCRTWLWASCECQGGDGIWYGPGPDGKKHRTYCPVAQLGMRKVLTT